MPLRDSKFAAGAKAARHEFFAPIPDGPLTPVALGIHSTAAQFTVGAFLYAIGGQIRYHAASTAHTLSAVHATGIGAWLGATVFIDEEGVISTQGNPDTGDQDHASEAAAFTSLDAMNDAPPIGKIPIGTITLETNAADWDGNTDAFDEADLVSSNLLGYKGDRRLGTYKPGWNFQVTAVRTNCRKTSGIGHIELLSPDATYTGMLTECRIEVDRRTVADAAVIKLRFGEFDYAIAGVVYHKAASKEVVFTAAHAVSLDKWGGILFQVDSAGAISTKAVLTPQIYTNEADARANVPAPDASKVAIATLIVEADAGEWLANTDDIVTASDLEEFDLLPVTLDRIQAGAALAIDATPEKFQVGAHSIVVDGVKYSKSAATAIVFSAAHVCALDKFLAILVEEDTAGVVTTKVPLVDGRSQTASQGFDDSTAAVNALPPETPGKKRVGYILIEADGTTWTANTDDMTAASDVDNATFVSDVVPTNSIFAVEAAVFVAETPTDAALATKTDPRRGTDQMLALLGGTTLVAARPQVAIEYRPWPLSGDVS
ncbi:hypothetical protein LCGC14_1607340 [marine sediment metagenome]|uniref:Uncharacterized protein n=1 Tax=marine sediment metagenome TaxID=412755 RepID=A0A0F9KQ67_9ZZZZ